MPESEGPEARPELTTAAAVDLGSNSFHMIVVQLLGGGEMRVVDKIKHEVRLAGGLDELGRLSPEAQDRALASLEMMGQRLRDLPPDAVRAVGTNTLRRARNGLPFLLRATRALGHRIDVISGQEEARLIFLGVSQDLPPEGRLLVVDIGGGSTEVIIGERREPLALDSLYMGCVSWSMRFFPEGQISREGMKAAVTAAELELEGLKRHYRQLGWDRAVGSSGTVNAIEALLLQNGLSSEGLTLEGLRRLRKLLLQSGRMDKVQLVGLSDSRRPVLPGGLAILLAVFDSLKVERMVASQSALREGLVYDLLGRQHHRDVREQAVTRMARRLGVDRAQAGRVRATALSLFQQVGLAWALDRDRSHTLLLGWAAELHEVGMFISHSGYHKHGAYLLQHADLPGFSRQEQATLAALVLSHRGKLEVSRISAIYPGPVGPILRLSALLRIARRMHRSRSPRGPTSMDARASPGGLILRFPAGYLDSHPLTRADLLQEAALLAKAGISLEMQALPPTWQASPAGPAGR